MRRGFDRPVGVFESVAGQCHGDGRSFVFTEKPSGMKFFQARDRRSASRLSEYAFQSRQQAIRFQNFFIDRYRAAYAREMDHFADILDGAKPLVDHHDGVAALELAEAAARSAREGVLVKL